MEGFGRFGKVWEGFGKVWEGLGRFRKVWEGLECPFNGLLISFQWPFDGLLHVFVLLKSIWKILWIVNRSSVECNKAILEVVL